MSMVDRIHDWQRRHPRLARRATLRAAWLGGHAKLGTRVISKRGRRGPGHFKAIIFRLRSPWGKIYEGRNVTSFVRRRPYLFDAADVIWKVPRKHASPECRASASLLHLNPRRKQPLATWKGWTWVSIQERRFNNRKDVLCR